MMRFVDVKNDVAFRKIFGNENEPQVLITFLNAVLGFEDSEEIESLELKNPHQFPRIAGERATIIDVLATDKRGRRFIIEMQVAEAAGFDKRVQYYVGREYSMQMRRGEGYKVLNPTIFIGILSFSYFASPGYLSNHLILDEKTHEHCLRDMRFCFIELPKFKKQMNELANEIDKWVYFIKNSKSLDVIPDSTESGGLRAAYEQAEMFRWTEDEWRAYDDAAIREEDIRGVESLALQRAEERGLEQGREQGREQGLERGLEQGRDAGIREVARRLRARGISVAEVAEMTGLGAAEVAELE